MITNTTPHSFATMSTGEATSFGISHKDEAHLMTVLRDTLYSDKILAILREYGANAWDAQREADVAAGRSPQPIVVKLPTRDDPTLHITDNGTGLSHDDVFAVFSQYGASTKRDSNDAVGCLGIGCKSGFAYSDTFTIVSRHGGRRRTYVAVIDESDRGKIQLFDDKACDATNTGVTIQIAIREDDIDEVATKARRVFRWFDPQPLGVDGLTPIVWSNAHGAIDLTPGNDDRGSWVAVMGCVAYPIDLAQVFAVRPCMKVTSGALRFPIGALHVAANREALKYNDTTKAALAEAIDAFFAQFIADSLRTINAAPTDWTRRLAARAVATVHGRTWLTSLKAGTAGVGVGAGPAATRRLDFAAEEVHFDKSDLYTIEYGRQRDTPSSVWIHPESRIIIRDDFRSLERCRPHLQRHDYVIKLSRKRPVALQGPPPEKDHKGRYHVQQWPYDEIMVPCADGEALAAAQTAIIEAGLDGIPVVLSSTLPWVDDTADTKTPTTSTTARRKPRRDDVLCRTMSSHWRSELRDNWSKLPDEFPPSDRDVWVTIRDYQMLDAVRDEINADAELLAAFKLPQGRLLGYKAHRLASGDIDPVGTRYNVWRTGLCERVLDASPQAREDVRMMTYVRLLCGRLGLNHWEFKSSRTDRAVFQLDATHPIRVLFDLYRKARIANHDWSSDHTKQVDRLYKHRPDAGATQLVEDAKRRWPLLFAHAAGFDVLFDDKYESMWLDYLRQG